MGVPSSLEANRFYRCAARRMVEARILIEAGQTTGAVYLAGYGVECMLKALILESLPAGRRPAKLRSFRTVKAHDLAWLMKQYLDQGGSRYPAEVARAFTLVREWSTEIRYDPRDLRQPEADRFVEAAETVVLWAKGRL